MSSFTSLVPNRILAAAGCLGFGNGWWFDPFLGVSPESFGAVVTKTITVEPRRGCYTWRYFRSFEPWLVPWKGVRRVENGFVNHLQVPNPGVREFAHEILPHLPANLQLIVSLAGSTEQEFTRMIWRLDNLPPSHVSILAYELNVSCPNLGPDWHWEADRSRLASLLTAVQRICRRPIIVKLGYPYWVEPRSFRPAYVGSLAVICESNGAAAIAAINAIPVDPATDEQLWHPTFPGGGSGEMIREYAEQVVQWLRERTRLPIIAIGGIATAGHCERYREKGADLVALGSAAHLPWMWPPKRWLQPRQMLRIFDELRETDEPFWFNTKPNTVSDRSIVLEASSP